MFVRKFKCKAFSIMDKKFRFLVPVDFSEQSLIALDQAGNLATRYNAELTILYVIDEKKTKRFFINEKHLKEIRSKAETEIKNLVNSIKKTKHLEVKGLVLEGNVSETIIDVAKNIQADLIAFGTEKKWGLKEQILGSKALKIIKTSPAPILTIKGKFHRHGCQTILLPLDLTKETTQKVQNAINISKRFEGAEIQILSVIWTTNQKEVFARLKAQMETVMEKISAEGVPCKGNIVKIIPEEDDFAETIVAFGEKINADLILIMTQQEENPVEMFIGSSAVKVINLSKIPVISFVPKSKQQ